MSFNNDIKCGYCLMLEMKLFATNLSISTSDWTFGTAVHSISGNYCTRNNKMEIKVNRFEIETIISVNHKYAL